jgi:hypothetical protein
MSTQPAQQLAAPITIPGLRQGRPLVANTLPVPNQG